MLVRKTLENVRPFRIREQGAMDRVRCVRPRKIVKPEQPVNEGVAVKAEMPVQRSALRLNLLRRVLGFRLVPILDEDVASLKGDFAMSFGLDDEDNIVKRVRLPLSGFFDPSLRIVRDDENE